MVYNYKFKFKKFNFIEKFNYKLNKREQKMHPYFSMACKNLKSLLQDFWN